jgi:hypothetical protein
MESNGGFSNDSNSTAAEARRTLDSLANDRHAFADRIRTPSWYYPLLGAATALIIGSPGGGDGAFSPPMMIVIGSVGLVFLEIAYKKATGVSMNRVPGPKSVGAAIVLCTLMLVLLGVSFALAATGNTSWIALSAGAAFFGMWVGGYFYDKVFTQELRGGR